MFLIASEMCWLYKNERSCCKQDKTNLYWYVSNFYIIGVHTYLPKTEITFVKFYVVEKLNKAMDTIRKKE